MQRRSEVAAPGLRPRFVDSVGLVANVMISGVEGAYASHFSTNVRLVNLRAVSKWRWAKVTLAADKSNEFIPSTYLLNIV
jgi:hypothetical protein